eukprot:35637-Heterocapsa_arctica.AAC.1
MAFDKFHKGDSQIAALVAITHDRRKQFGGLTVLRAASMGEIHEVIAGVEFIVIAIYDLITLSAAETDDHAPSFCVVCEQILDNVP